MGAPAPYLGFRHVASARFGSDRDAHAAAPELTSAVEAAAEADLRGAARALRSLLEEFAVTSGEVAVYPCDPSAVLPVPGTLATIRPVPPTRWTWYARVDAASGEVHLYRRQEWD